MSTPGNRGILVGSLIALVALMVLLRSGNARPAPREAARESGPSIHDPSASEEEIPQPKPAESRIAEGIRRDYGSLTKEQYAGVKAIELKFNGRIEEAVRRRDAYVQSFVAGKIANGEVVPRGEYWEDRKLNAIFTRHQHPELFKLMDGRREVEQLKKRMVEDVFKQFARPEPESGLPPPNPHGDVAPDRVREIRSAERERRMSLSKEGWSQYALAVERWAPQLGHFDASIDSAKKEIMKRGDPLLPSYDYTNRLILHYSPEKQLVVLDRAEMPALPDLDREGRELSHDKIAALVRYIQESGGYQQTPDGFSYSGYWEEAHLFCDCLGR